MGTHFKVECKDCGTVITQCRCPSKDKETRYDLCASCTKAIIAEAKQEKGI